MALKIYKKFTITRKEEMQRVEQIKEVLQTLPAQCRTVFTIVVWKEKYKEIADELGISVNTRKVSRDESVSGYSSEVGGNTLYCAFMLYKAKR